MQQSPAQLTHGAVLECEEYAPGCGRVPRQDVDVHLVEPVPMPVSVEFGELIARLSPELHRALVHDSGAIEPALDLVLDHGWPTDDRLRCLRIELQRNHRQFEVCDTYKAWNKRARQVTTGHGLTWLRIHRTDTLAYARLVLSPMEVADVAKLNLQTISKSLALRTRGGRCWPGDWATAYAHQWDGTVWGCKGTYRQKEGT